ncbi:MAG: flagellar basal body rod protein FlgC [Deltaproteobacteria bacterium]|nr:flagellar basal body rod protein FlgC [Deltaproteobacteria bacterium]
MNIFRIFDVTGAGMGAQRSRMSVVAGNLANVETTRTPEGGPYRRRNVLFRAAPIREEFPSLLQASLGSKLPIDLQDRTAEIRTVEVAGVRESLRAPKKVYDPHHPDADAEGYVAYPDINTMEEMVDLLSATRSYEANLAAFNATKTLIRRLLEMGRTL